MSTHHTIDYIEFTVRDLPAAKRFYSTAFGWQFNDYGPEYAGIKGAAVLKLDTVASPLTPRRVRQ